MNNNPLCNVSNRTIYIKDNLDILKGINSESIDLIYLDPPFNTNKTWHAPIGSTAEGASFKDKFGKEDMKDEWVQTIREDLPDLSEFLEGIKGIGPIYRGADANYCYCCYMSIRLIEIHRILRNTGSVYLHVDPTMSHYLKLIMDCIFGYKNFRNEIAWKRNAGHGKGNQYTPKKYGALNDTIIFYVKSNNYFFDPYIPLTKKEIDAKFDNVDAQQRRYYTHQIMCDPAMPSRPNLCYTYNGVTNPYPSG